MSTDQRWRWAGIVSVVSVGGVLLTDIAANVVGGYISDRIKTWDVPQQAPAVQQAPASAADTVSSIPPQASEGQVTMAAVAPKPASAPMPEIDIGEPTPAPDAEPEAATAPEPMPLPPPELQPSVLSGTVEQVIDTATLQIQGETIELAGIKGLGSPYRDQLAKFIEEQGSQIRCEPIDERYVCFVKNVDLGLAALTNGAARPALDATPQYRQASDEARRNRRAFSSSLRHSVGGMAMTTSRTWIVALVLVLGAGSLLAGCGAPGSRQSAGAGIGAVAGGVTGGLIARRAGFNPIGGAVIGAVAGGLVGSAIGKSLDDEERRQLALASELAAEQPVVKSAPPKKVQWKRTDPQTNTVTASGWVVPKSEPYQKPDGTTCREVTQNVSKNGQTQSQDVTLCRTQVAQADGSNWVIPQ